MRIELLFSTAYLSGKCACFAKMVDQLSALGHFAANVSRFDGKQQRRRTVTNNIRLKQRKRFHYFHTRLQETIIT